MSLSFCPVLEELYRTRQAIGSSGNIFSLTSGLSTVNNLTVIRKIMLESKPAHTLEIGLACGGSALTFASTHKDLGRTPNHQHVAIDGFQTVAFDNVGRMKIMEAGLSGYVEIRESLSSQELPKMVEEEKKFQLIYIDGSHKFEDVFVDFYYIRQLASVGGHILFDDSSDCEVRKVLKFIRKNYCDFYKIIPTSRYRNFSITEKVKYTVGQYLNKTQLTIFQKVSNGELG